MKNIYFFTSFLMILFSLNVVGQSRIYAPDLAAPENYGMRQMPDAILNWNAVTGGGLEIEYEAQLSLTPDFSNALTFDKTPLTAITMSKLLFGQQYFWRVRAYDGSEVSDWSEVWNFSVLNSFRFEANPADGDEVYTNQTVKWESIIGLLKYEVQVDSVTNWNITPSGTTDNLNGIVILAADDKWAVGDDGLIMHYDGVEWSVVDAGITKDLFDVWFVDGQNGYAVGASGTIIYYDGATWTEQVSGVSKALYGVSFSDVNTGMAVGDDGTILAYSGGTWTAQTAPETSPIMDVYVLSGSRAWACGEDSFIYSYDGTEWTSEEIGIRDYNSVWFNNENDGWVVGKKGSIFHYDGMIWVAMDPGTKNDLFSVHFDGDVGYASGVKGTICMYNGDWSKTTSGYFDEDLFSVFVSGSTAIAVGESGAMTEITAEGFNSPFLRTFNENTSNGSREFDSIYFKNLLFGKTFYYRVRGMHALDTTDWSGVKSFKTFAAPNLKKPNNGSTDTHLSLELKWEEYEGASQYGVEVSNEPNFNFPLTYVSDSVTTRAKVTEFDQKFYWRVRAVHPLDISIWSEVFNFTTLKTVALMVPENEGVGINKCPRFEWTNVAGVPNYEIWLDVNADFSNPEIGVVDRAYMQCQSSLNYDTEYFWKVRGITAVEESEWSDVFSFRTEAQIGVEEYFTNESVSLHPNPSNGDVFIGINSLVDDVYSVTIADITGRLISETEMVCFSGENEMQLNVDGLKKGIYVVGVRKNNTIITKKLFVE